MAERSGMSVAQENRGIGKRDMNVELRQRTFGELLGLSFRLSVAHFGKLFFISAVLGLPLLLLQLAMIETAKDVESRVLGLAALGLFVTLILQPIQQGASILAISGSFTGKHLSLGACLGIALRRLFPILMFSIAIGLIMILGLILLVIPLLIFITWYYVGAPALVVENISWQSAMQRSKSLSEGHRWGIFGFFLVTVLLVLFVTAGAEQAVGALMGPGTLGIVVLYFVEQIIALILLVGPVVYYFHLRVVKEAFDVETLSALVDAIAVRHEASGSEGPAR